MSYRLIINPIVHSELRYYEFLSSFLVISTFSEVSRASPLIFLVFSAHNYLVWAAFFVGFLQKL